MLVDPKYMRFYARMSSAVLAKAILIAIGYYAGSSLDAKYQTYPILLFVCVTVALGIGIFAIVWIAEKESVRLEGEGEGGGPLEGPTRKTPRVKSDDDDEGSNDDDDEPKPAKKKRSNPKIYT